ncbi:hypothetical protein JCM10213_001002, partial [Rhodosporidiobolus nylandii]
MKGVLTSSSKTTLEWRVDGVKALLDKAKSEAETKFSITSPISFDGRWEMKLNFKDSESPTFIGLYLHPEHTLGDLYQATASHMFVRSETTWSFELLDDDKKLLQGIGTLTQRFEDDSGWGFANAIESEMLEGEAVSKADAFIIRCTFAKDPGADFKPPFPADVAADLCNNADYADVAFRIRPSESSAASYILCTKLLLNKRSPHLKTLLDSGFSESSSLERVDPHTLTGAAAPLAGDGNDFEVFEEALIPQAPAHVRTQSSPVVAVGRSRSPSTSSSGSPRKKQKTDQPESNKADNHDSAEAALRFLQIINITDRSYATYHSLLFFLHTGMTNFTPSVADYLVARSEAIEKDKDAQPEERNVWLTDAALREDPPPCNPHALYRLADEYLVDKLRELAKGFIIRSLTVENVAYEAFCQLSMEYDDFQKDVLVFLLANW